MTVHQPHDRIPQVELDDLIEILDELYEPTPIDQLGVDHWSTLAYVETCIVDRRGHLELRKLRGHSDPDITGDHPTRLADGTERHDHDDLDCIGDLVNYGFLRVLDHEGLKMPWLIAPHDILDSYIDPVENGRFGLTALGVDLCASLRTHKATGGSFASFRLPDSAAFRARLQGATSS